MKRSSVGGLVLAGLMAVLLTGSASAGEGEAAKRIAVVNVSRVFKAYKKVQDIQSNLEKQFKQTKDSLEAEEDGLRKDVQATGPEFDPEKKRDDLQKAQNMQIRKFDLERKKFEFLNLVEKARLEEMKQVLKEIRAAISAVGKGKTIDMVMRAPEFDWEGRPDGEQPDGEAGDETAPRTSTELVRRFRENPVLYFSAGVDVTKDVIDKLNDDYEKAGGTKK